MHENKVLHFIQKFNNLIFNFKDGTINWNDLQTEIRYDSNVAYGQSKLGNVLFSAELARRYKGKYI